jgi:spore germination protein (amino acid permease)
MQPAIKENQQVSSFFVFYLIFSMQIGVGILGFERYIVKDAGYDAWLSILVAGIGIHVVLWLSYKLLDKGKGDLIEIHSQLFGKWIGGIFSFLFILYCLALGVTVLRTFTEVIQVWVFPQLSTWIFSAVFLAMALAFVSGGIRVVTGICFLSALYGLPLLLIKYFPLKHAHFENLLPLFSHSIGEILKSTETMTLNFIGFELLFLYYPYIKDAASSQRWAHYGVMYSTVIYLISAVVSFVYYSEEQIAHIIWSTPTLWKIVDLPFVERFEYVGLGLWVTVVLPNICLSLWAAARGVNRLFANESSKPMIILVLIILFASAYLTSRSQIDLLNTMISKIGFYLLYAYIPFLFVWQWLIFKIRKNPS